MKKKTVVVLVLLAGTVVLIALAASRPKEPTKVITAKAERVPTLRHVVDATGEIRAKEFVDIQAEVDGVVTELRVREGDTVKQGDVLLRIQDLPLKAAEDAARAQVGAGEAEASTAEFGIATAEATLAAERTALANVKIEFEQSRTSRDRAQASFRRKEEMFQSNLIGSEEYEIAAAEARLAQQRYEWNEARIEQADANLRAVATRVDAAKATKEAACRRVEAAKAELARAADQVSKTIVRAPLSGLITKLNIEKGERAVPGIQSNPISTLMTIADMSVIEAEIKVGEADIVDVAVGAPAEISVDAIRDVKFAGVVTEIGHSPIQPLESGGSSSNQSQEGKTFKVVIRLTSPPPTLRPGFTAEAEITTATRTDVLVVPHQAQTAREIELDAEGNYVRPPEPKEGEKPEELTAARRQNLKEKDGVFVLVDGRVHFRPIKTGIEGGLDVEVLEGLQPGDEVVIGPIEAMRTLKEWDRVQIDEERQKQRSLRRPR